MTIHVRTRRTIPTPDVFKGFLPINASARRAKNLLKKEKGLAGHLVKEQKS
jgi:hypothetical protein